MQAPTIVKATSGHEDHVPGMMLSEMTLEACSKAARWAHPGNWSLLHRPALGPEFRWDSSDIMSRFHAHAA